MKIATTSSATLLFHGNAKDESIQRGLDLAFPENTIKAIIAKRGIYNPNASNNRRYAEKIRNALIIPMDVKKIRVTDTAR